MKKKILLVKNKIKDSITFILIIVFMLFMTLITQCSNNSSYGREKCMDETGGDIEECYGDKTEKIKNEENK